MAKSADAFRTISEVADWLETPAHVLRFWESKFSQVKPVKRAGGRRYYRPADMQLLGGIKKLLHDDGMTIKGVQKLLREHGVKHVAALSQALDEVTEIEASEIAKDITPDQETPATVLTFRREEAQPKSGTVPEAPATEPASAPQTSSDAAKTADAPVPSAARDDASASAQSDVPEENEPPDVSSEASEADVTEEAHAADAPPVMPSFLRSREAAPMSEGKAAVASASAPTPAHVDVPEDPDDDVSGPPGVLSRLAAPSGPIPAERIEALRALIQTLDSLRR